MTQPLDFEFLNTIKGFMDDDEALRLYDLSLTASRIGPVLEIGSYCGRSAAIIGPACKQNGGILFSVDHHAGSEEQQPGEEYFDPDLYDEKTSSVNTFPLFRLTLSRAGLENTVVPIVCTSKTAGRMWKTPLSMVFIDGGHSFEAAHTDFLTWAPHIIPGGFLVIHDIFFNPEEGGQPPRQIYEEALATGNYEALEITKTLGVLRVKDLKSP
ncbi:class I SAM-dependent methyltransferase [Desulfobacter hydrogenophilus]|uniref:Class I SAM-dependent methyltransferase n=1 Tax=Desulfobacter hydrogenophilus TaxID=2291 RepID=A0A328F9E6_9BACT|nr:class I SAM-dependent methyltransferase [Desulfobacter hydrogenophilus]NDY73255.1 class I SAM-dependent methyltransferase [Desulfobacter hydrogenophilus]QBH13831.1 class I SAM-dependent methyltransferase [Desulfobacter hydrogenophilus]RAM00846.1 class I SAM-dependent methyltransferase [Desulfobacter hydrogenophilus]